MDGETMPASGILNIRTWRDRTLRGEPMGATTPLQVAEALEGYAAETMKLTGSLRPAQSKELRLTLGDYQAMAWLGRYYAEKILGAAQLSLFDATGDTERQREAVGHLRNALEHWKRYAAAATSQYKPQLLNRVGHVNLLTLTDKVAADVAMAEGWQPRKGATSARAH